MCTIVANVIGGISRNGRSTHGLLMTTKRMQCFALRLRVDCCGGGQDTAGTIGIRGNNAFATDESRTSKVFGGLVNFLVY